MYLRNFHMLTRAAMHKLGDIPSTMPPIRGYNSIASHSAPLHDHSEYRSRDYMPSTSAGDDTILDPVSALLRAGEIVNQNSRGHSNS